MRLHQITEKDLGDLERECAALCDELMAHLATRQKRRVRVIKRIISDVRWNYGPPVSVEEVPVDDTEAA